MTEPNVPPPPPPQGSNDPYDTAPPSAPPPPPNPGTLNPTPTPTPLPTDTPFLGYSNASSYGYPGPYVGPPPDNNAKSMGMLCHLLALAGLLVPGVGGWAGPLIIWLLKKNEHPFIDDQGKESLNFQLTMIIASLVLSPTICLFGIGIVLLIIVGVMAVVFSIIGGIRANNGEAYRYPFALRLIK